MSNASKITGELIVELERPTIVVEKERIRLKVATNEIYLQAVIIDSDFTDAIEAALREYPEVYGQGISAHLEALEAKIERLQARIAELDADMETAAALAHGLDGLHAHGGGLQ